MPEKNIAQSLLEEAAKIVKDNQDPNKKSYAQFIFGSLLDAKRAGMRMDANDTWTLAFRDDCVEMIRTIRDLFNTDRSVLAPTSSEKNTKKVNMLRGKIYSLRKLGIVPYKYREQDPETLLNNPLEIAMYAASMLITTVDENVWYGDKFHDVPLPILSPALEPVILREIEHANRFIGEEMGTMTEKIPNH